MFFFVPLARESTVETLPVKASKKKAVILIRQTLPAKSQILNGQKQNYDNVYCRNTSGEGFQKKGCYIDTTDTSGEESNSEWSKTKLWQCIL